MRAPRSPGSRGPKGGPYGGFDPLMGHMPLVPCVLQYSFSHSAWMYHIGTSALPFLGLDRYQWCVLFNGIQPRCPCLQADPLEGALGGFSDDDDDVSSEDEDLTADGLGDGRLGHRTMGGDGDIEFDANDFLSSMRALLGDLPGAAGDATEAEAAEAADAPKSPEASEGSAEASRGTPNKSKVEVDETGKKDGQEKEAGIAEYAAMMDAELQGRVLCSLFFLWPDPFFPPFIAQFRAIVHVFFFFFFLVGNNPVLMLTSGCVPFSSLSHIC